ncbi:FKBP-type peptidyl-prolyl cis-trans isomerase [Flavobacterium restrictum]|uniref:FKBP-type peptidylprolyl isomerase n=1 Tax=Flavobacterium restrictum TaxID=2594428 RepID=A0A553EAW3_9FLAO|nr:FKBP-type peptidylprolyl isomerase [Flavobacterium restrictum]TRX42102.1 FKBP-type peptidylprolyl isomerase [Flavobacterium restrictum]
MNKFKFYFIVTIATVTLFSCSKNDSATIEPPRDFAVQYATDLINIEQYLNTFSITVTNDPGATDDQDVVFTKITDPATQPSIMSYKDNLGYPRLTSRDVPLHGIVYKLYYLVLREGSGSKPCNVDGVLTSYRGDYLEQITADKVTTLTATKFEELKFPQTYLSLYSTITGWGEIFPQFKTGTYASNPNGTVSYNDFGAGVMFIPSGLAYYNYGSGTIPAYAPLVFSFKLYEIQRLDQDADGIFSYQEDKNGDGYVYDMRDLVKYPTTTPPTVNPDDTEADGIPDFLDVDDDGDNYTTKLELKKPDGTYHTFETIPSCSGQTVKRHLTASCKPPYQD